MKEIEVKRNKEDTQSGGQEQGIYRLEEEAWTKAKRHRSGYFPRGGLSEELLSGESNTSSG